MRRYIVMLTLGLTLICIGGLALALQLGRMLVLPDNELLFNANLRGGNSDIYRMDIAHRLVVPVTKDSAVNAQAVWSPDGQQIAFDSNREGQYTVFIMDAQGRNVHRLSNDATYSYGPSWSPDGRYMAYISTQFPISPELMLMDMQSGKIRRLTDNREAETTPDWSPDGKHLAVAFDTTRPRFMNIFNLDIQTDDFDPMFVTPDYKRSPRWSRDGRSVLYIVWGSNAGLYIWDIAKEQSKRLYAPKDFSIRDPDWSPDGRYVVYAPLTSNNDNHIYLLDVPACLDHPDCSPQPLSLPSGIYADPHWRPNPS